MSSRRSRGQYDGKIAGLYDLEDTIGRGHFAVVKLARHVFTGEKVAVKVIDKTKLDEVSKAHLFQEVRCMKLVQHPNVVRLYEVIDTQTKLYLILELGDGGDMYDYIMKHDKGLDEEVARRYFNQIVQAIHYCHKLHVVHRDLKPENVVFFEKPGIVKLTDFGFSNKFIPGRKLETSCGSLAYSAPEILLGDSYDAPAVDVWSLGVILYMLVCGEAPFQEANDSETLTMIMDCRYRMPPHVSDECQSLISQMLVREPKERALLGTIMNHAWLKLGGNMTRVPFMPLISREILSPEDHEYIIQKMVDGKIASREEIVQSLELDSYNHVTATFYLLAERKLRRHHEQAAMANNQNNQEASEDGNNKTQLAPLALSPRSARQKIVEGQVYTCTCDNPSEACPCVQSADAALNQMERSRRQTMVDSLVSPPGVHPSSAGPSSRGLPHSPSSPSFPLRRCSLIQEESIEEDEEDMEVEMESSQLQGAKSADILSDDSVGSPSQGSPSRHASPSRRTPGVRPLHTVRSSPQLLNQIFEEGESEDEDSGCSRRGTSPKMQIQRKPVASPDVLRKYEHRKKRLTTGNRGTSCSSSDASDTDETDSHKRKEKLKGKFHRKDSSDHSSDNDGPSGPPGPSANNRPWPGNSSGKDHNKDRDNDKKDKDKDRDKGSKGNNENKGSKERRHSIGSGGKSNSFSSPGGRKDSGGSENLPQLELARRISTLSVGSNLSNLSLASLNSRSSKYLLDSSANTPRSGLSQSDINTLNEENKARTRIIHVRSKEFSDLMDRFGSPKKPDSGTSSGSKDHQSKLRRRSKDKIKTDINRNGLINRGDSAYSEVAQKSRTESGMDSQQQNSVVQSGVVTTKCCSLV